MSDTDSGVPEESNAHYVEGRAEPTAALRTGLERTLRTDLRRVLAGCPLEQSGLRENLRAIATHARRHQLRAEQLLVLIKEVCATRPEARELLGRRDHPETIDKLIPMAVDEYYRP